MDRNELAAYLDTLLECGRFRDYCPNGLQVEGKAEVRRLVSGVTASQALLDRAVAIGADAVMVHHGYFWRGEDPRVVGVKRGRLATLDGDAAEVVAPEVDEHEVLRVLLGVGAELLLEEAVALRILPARAGARDRMRLDRAARAAVEHSGDEPARARPPSFRKNR